PVRDGTGAGNGPIAPRGAAQEKIPVGQNGQPVAPDVVARRGADQAVGFGYDSVDTGGAAAKGHRTGAGAAVGPNRVAPVGTEYEVVAARKLRNRSHAEDTASHAVARRAADEAVRRRDRTARAPGAAAECHGSRFAVPAATEDEVVAARQHGYTIAPDAIE